MALVSPNAEYQPAPSKIASTPTTKPTHLRDAFHLLASTTVSDAPASRAVAPRFVSADARSKLGPRSPSCTPRRAHDTVSVREVTQPTATATGVREAPPAMARGGRVLHGVAGYHTILNTAIPAIADALKVAPLSMKSVLTSYTLSVAVFIPDQRLGAADRYGTRRVLARQR